MSVLYSNQKFLRFSDHLQALRDGTVVAPVHVRIKPTNHCNHDCWYCAYKVSNLQLGEDMVEADAISVEKMAAIADDLIAMQVKAVTFSGGGEPLMYKPIPEVVEQLAKGGVRVATLTNGANLKGRVAEAFARYGTWIRISIDGWDDASYREARGLKGDAFSQVVGNMREFSARDTRCVLGISFIITETNHRHIAEACATFKAAGVNHVKLSGVVVANKGAENNRYHREMQKQVGEQIRQAKTLADDRFTILDHYHELSELFEKSYQTCPFLQFLTVIGADCKVYACQDKAYTEGGLLGSIRDRSFREFWFSEENRQRIYALDPSISCRHHCVTHSKNLAIHDFLSIDPEHGLFV